MTPPSSAARDRTNRLAILALWLVFYCSFTLFSPPLLDDADSVHAEVAREMLTRHDFITLYANGIRYLEKAPLYYWSMAASMKLFGATTAASRLPLAFAVLALALLMESWARRAFSQRAGLYAALITLSSFGIFIFSRINIPDVLVCVLLTLSLYAFFLTEQQDQPTRLLCWTFDAAIALNILTKGLIGIVFPVAIVALYLLATRGLRGTLRRLLECHPLSSTAILLAIAVPWHVLIALANPGHGHPGNLANINGHWQVPLPTDGNVHGWAWFYFVNEQLYRYLNIRVPHDYDTSPLWLFYGLIFIWLMPWSAFLPSALTRAWPSWQQIRSRALDLQQRTNLFLILWMLVPLLFFSLSTRQEYYVLPSLPPMILLIANFLTQPAREGDRRRSEYVLGFISLAIAAFCVFLIVSTRTPSPGTDLSTLLQQNPGNYALSFGHFLDLNARAMGMFRVPLALTAVAFGLIVPAACWMRATRRDASTLTLAAAGFVFLFATWLGLRTFSPTLTSAQLADAIWPQLHPQDLLAIHGEYEAGSTLGFYLHRNDIHIVEGRSSNLWYGSFFPDAPHIFETRESIAQKWSGSQRIFLWQDPSDHDRSPLQLPQPVYVIAKSGGKQILSNQPAKSGDAPMENKTDNIVIGAPLDPNAGDESDRAHAVPIRLQALTREGGHAWLCSHEAGSHHAVFRIEFDPPYASDATETVPIRYGKGRFMSQPESDSAALLAELARALEAHNPIPRRPRVDRLEFTYVDFGHDLSVAAAGGLQTKPAGDWTAMKIFLGENSEEDEGEVFFFFNRKTGEAEFVEKDAEYGDIVLEHLASVL